MKMQITLPAHALADSDVEARISELEALADRAVETKKTKTALRKSVLLALRFERHLANKKALQPIVDEALGTVKNVMAICGRSPHDYSKLQEVCAELGSAHVLEADEDIFDEQCEIMCLIQKMRAQNLHDLGLKARSVALTVDGYDRWRGNFDDLDLDIQRIRDLIESVIRVAGQTLPFDKWCLDSDSEAVAA